MRFVLAVYLLVVIVLVALCGFGATLPQRHRRRHERKHLIHLQDKVDNLLLQQEINKIYITNLQETVQQLQVKHFSSDDGSSTPSLSLSVKELDVERQALADLREEVAEVRDTMKEALQEEEHQDEMTQIRQELAYLRSELQRVKETKATETIQMSAHTQAQEQREAVTAAWVVDNVKRLQNNVVDLQQALNVTQAMHDKQEVESRLTVVTKDLSALRGSLAAVTSKAEAAAAVSSALQEELTRTSKDMHRTAGQTGALSLELSHPPPHPSQETIPTFTSCAAQLFPG
ncbi:hypothetical protein Pmani_008331 [Petrolisthes manimaculis]|uniref:Uncharacterized protein n=1 Tax=Petrolisthes manimaculis TaxID=1843537 RepID=A0AAE1Q7A7_9EUCA|nr:hypothetical protein Pmani_008331 [Petrolisthes manimaculis]